MHGIFVHILEVEDSWLHYDIPGKPWPYGDRPPEAFKTFDEVEAYDRELAVETRDLMGLLVDADLRKEVRFQGSRGLVRSAIEDILIHTFIDEMAHLGELICLMWHLDVEPPHANWLEFHHTPSE